MQQGHSHECEYQVVVTAIARAIAEQIARLLARMGGEGVVAASPPQGLPATLSVAQAAKVMGIGRNSV